MTKPVLVSACLLGRRCRYDGRHNQDDGLLRMLRERDEEPVPFCPEEAGGLGTPRPPAWIQGSAAEVVEGTGQVVTNADIDVTGDFLLGARKALDRCEEVGARRAYLKERSPSCGVCQTHVEHELVDGPGVTAEILRRAGIEPIGVEGRRG